MSSTIGNLPPGAPAQATDQIPIQRGTTQNFKLLVSDITALAPTTPPGGSSGDIQFNNGAGGFAGSLATLTSGGTLTIPAGQSLNWNADAGISRLAPATLAIGDGTAGDYSGSLTLAQVNLESTPQYPSPGLGVTNVNAAATTSMTLNINVGDCVVIFINTNGTLPVVTDNGSTPNVYVKQSATAGGYGNGYVFVCLSAAYAATSVSTSSTGSNPFCIEGATFTGVGSIGTATAIAYNSASNPLSTHVTTVGNNSIVVAAIQYIGNDGTFTATSGTEKAHTYTGTISQVLLTQQVSTSGTVATSAGNVSVSPQSGQGFSIELIPFAGVGQLQCNNAIVGSLTNPANTDLAATFLIEVPASGQDVCAVRIYNGPGNSVFAIDAQPNNGLGAIACGAYTLAFGPADTDGPFTVMVSNTGMVFNNNLGIRGYSDNQTTLTWSILSGEATFPVGGSFGTVGVSSTLIANGLSTQGPSIFAVNNETGAVFSIGASGSVNFKDDLNFGNVSAIFGSGEAIVINHNYIALGSTTPIAWALDSHAYDSLDTGISRLAAGSLAIGNGTAGDFSGSLKLTGLSVQGALTDGAASTGTSGYLLSSTATGVKWIAAPSGTTWAALTGDLTETQVIPWDGPTVGTKDTGISRLAAGSLAIGNGTAGDSSGTLLASIYGFGATVASTAPDTGISRIGAASLAIGNGTAGDFSGSLKLGAGSSGSPSLIIGTAGCGLWETGGTPVIVSTNGTICDFYENTTLQFDIFAGSNLIQLNANGTGNGAGLRGNITSSATPAIVFGNSTNFTATTSTTQIGVQIGGTITSYGLTFNPASGTASFIACDIVPTIKGTSSGNTTALVVNPTLTATNLTGTNLIASFQSGGSQVLGLDYSGDILSISGSVHSWNADSGISRLAAGSLAIGNGTASDTTGNLSFNKVIKYAGVATVSGGIPAEYATVDLTAQTGAISGGTLYTPAASGMFRVSWTADITTADSTASVLGGTNGFQVTYTSPTDSVSKTTVAGNSVTSAANTTGTAVGGCLVVYAKTGVAMTYSYGYTATTGNMAYELHIKVEAL